MKKFICTLFVLLSVELFAQNSTKSFLDINYIEVIGKAKMEVTPNEIFIDISINEKDFKNKSVLEIEKSLTTKLEEIGINVSKQLSIRDIASNFRDYWLKKASIKHSKYYQLIVGNANTAGRVFRELESIGILNISISKVSHSNLPKFREDVKISAAKAAKKKAKYLVNAVDQKIGKALYIEELKTYDNRFNYELKSVSNIIVKMDGNAQNQESEIEFKKIILEYSILVRFEIL